MSEEEGKLKRKSREGNTDVEHYRINIIIDAAIACN